MTTKCKFIWLMNRKLNFITHISTGHSIKLSFSALLQGIHFQFGSKSWLGKGYFGILRNGIYLLYWLIMITLSYTYSQPATMKIRRPKSKCWCFAKGQSFFTKFSEILPEVTVYYVITIGTSSRNFWQTYSPTSLRWILSNQSAVITHAQTKKSCTK
jgi:hypothetical protein